MPFSQLIPQPLTMLMVYAQAPAVSGKMLGMVATVPNNLAGIRDRALLLLGFAGAFSEARREARTIHHPRQQRGRGCFTVRARDYDGVFGDVHR